MNLRRESANQLSQQVASFKEGAVREAINHAMGSVDWTLEEVLGRAMWKVYRSTGVEQFEFDGEPLLEFYSPDFDSSHDGASIKLTAEQRWRKLY